MNDHSGGGGYVAVWSGLNLINEFVEDNYHFSYELTRLYYEKLREDAEITFNNNPSNENYVTMLNLYADLGLWELCEDSIEMHPDLVGDDNFDYISYSEIDSEMFDNYFDYVISRALYYEIEWENMSEWI